MTITQTVEIPADRRVHLDFEVPREVPTGKARVEFKVIPFVKKEEPSKTVKSLVSLMGIDKGIDTMDAYFARKRADKAFEDGLIPKNPYLKER